MPSPRMSAIVAVLAHLALSTAQTATSLPGPPTLPACAAQCTLLTQASDSCASNPSAYTSCFCQSTLLTPLLQSTSNLCAPQCSDADFTTIATWYKGQCSAGGAAPATPQTTLSTMTTNAPGSVTTTAGSVPSSANLGSPGLPADEAGMPAPSLWFSNHWRWIVMLIVLAIAFILIAVALSWIHKRNKRRREEAENPGPRPEMAEWAPNHSVHDVRNFGAAEPSRSRPEDNGKGKETAGTAVGPGSGNRKLKSKRGVFGSTSSNR